MIFFFNKKNIIHFKTTFFDKNLLFLDKCKISQSFFQYLSSNLLLLHFDFHKIISTFVKYSI